MTIEILQQELGEFAQQGQLVAVAYFVLRDNGNYSIKKADIKAEIQPDIASLFMGNITERVIQNDDLTLVNVSEADNRSNGIFSYDLQAKPREMQMAEDTAALAAAPFLQRGESLDRLHGLIVVIGNGVDEISIFSKHYPTSLMARGGPFSVAMGAGRIFDRLTTDILRISGRVNFFMWHGIQYVVDIDVLEKFMEFKQIIKNEANRGLSVLTQSGLVNDMASLSRNLNDMSFARKLAALSDSPVLNVVPNNEIIEFIVQHHLLSKKIKITADGNQIILGSKTAQKHLLKLLNDDYLKSDLTNRLYDTHAKDSLTPRPATLATASP